WSECSGLDPEPEVCDGQDNDCDGVTDEQLAGCECIPWTQEPCGIRAGRCYPGRRHCNEDGTWGACEGGRQPEIEVCDGWDNDCDEVVDEPEELEPPPDRACREEGICAGRSRLLCQRGRWTCIYPPGFELEERSCDGLDNDCDGEVDEGVFLPEASRLPHPESWDDEECWARGDWEGPDGCCPPRFRIARCTPQGFVACCLFEICGDAPGRDDDCDGRPDAEQCLLLH
ncbi:MAG: hypothetical protein FJ125_17385, partial [Deltaproteobacteria bacterium]|nr:hypothetical protein [Deltaproteobacteria bacterium]